MTANRGGPYTSAVRDKRFQQLRKRLHKKKKTSRRIKNDIMKKTKSILSGIAFAAVAVCLSSSTATASVACTSFLGASVLLVNTAVPPGCTVGNFTFSNFAVGLAGGSGTPLVQISGINDPGVGGTGLNFNPNLGSGHTVTDLHFLFEVTANSGLISIISEYLANNGTGLGGIGERICDNAGVSLGGTCTGSQIATLSALSGGSTSVTFPGQQSVWVWKDISINNPLIDTNSSFDQNFGSSSSVPEPMTLSMMGAGLLGLSLISGRRKKS